MKERANRQEFEDALDDVLQLWFNQKEQEYEQMAQEGISQEEITHQRKIDAWFLILDIFGESWAKKYRELTKGKS